MLGLIGLGARDSGLGARETESKTDGYLHIDAHAPSPVTWFVPLFS